jgi:hypothetical protein
MFFAFVLLDRFRGSRVAALGLAGDVAASGCDRNRTRVPGARLLGSTQ